MGYKIYPLNTGYLYSEDGLPPAAPPGPNSHCHVPALAFLVTNGVDHLLVDTGMPDTSSALRHRPYSAQPEGFDIVSRLAERGIFPYQLQAILLTHLHWDHCAYMAHFPGVKKLIQRAEEAFAQDPPQAYKKSFEGARDALCDLDLETVSGGFDFGSEIRVIPSPGHTPGHQSVVVHTAKGPYILAGDAAWFDPLKGLTPPRKATDPGAAKRSFDNLGGLGIPILPSHDPVGTGTHVYG
jgi:N-acyl homoserine lactone hydrolase